MKLLSLKTTYQLEAVDEPSGDDYTTSSDTIRTNNQHTPAAVSAGLALVNAASHTDSVYFSLR